MIEDFEMAPLGWILEMMAQPNCKVSKTADYICTYLFVVEDL